MTVYCDTLGHPKNAKATITWVYSSLGYLNPHSSASLSRDCLDSYKLVCFTGLVGLTEAEAAFLMAAFINICYSKKTIKFMELLLHS